MNSLMITDATILTMDRTSNIFFDCDILVENGIITAIGKKLVHPKGVEILWANGAIVMPGLVNAHTHLAMAYFRSFAAGQPLEQWLRRIFSVEARMTEEQMYYGAAVACIEALESGTTCVNDMYLGIQGTPAACADSGIRAYLSLSACDAAGGIQMQIERMKKMYERWNGACEGRIKVMLAAHAEYTCSEELLKACRSLALQWKCALNIHLSETEKEVNACRERHCGLSPVAWLEKSGIFEGRTIAAHCVWIDENDGRIIKRNNCYPVHNPISNLKLGSGVAPIPEMLAVGINPALGTDGNGSNDNLDMFREMSMTAVLHNGIQRNALALTAQQVIHMATCSGAEALGYHGGILEEGAVADIIVLNSPKFAPMHDPYALIAYSASAGCVRYTIVNGRVVVKNGVCVTMDRERIYRQFRRCSRELFQ